MTYKNTEKHPFFSSDFSINNKQGNVNMLILVVIIRKY
jgi:hypothetical protein